MNKISEENLKNLHKPVLLEELVNNIKINKTKKNIIIDCTLGMGGHAEKVLEKMNPGDVFVGFDADKRNLEIVKDYIEKKALEKNIKFFFVNDNFENLKIRLKELNITKITGIYYDLGISSLHIDDPNRGFSLKKNGPLDMRYDISKGITASEILNSYSKKDLIRIFKEYGEEPLSKKIAEEIILERKKGIKFKQTLELSKLIEKVSRFPKTKTRIFQALRIETNKELDTLKKSLNDAIDLLEKDGIIFVISFHSLEDRIVKNIFKNETKDCICKDLICTCKHKKRLQIITKKPIIPTLKEIKLNSRSRSAKARIAKKI